MKGTDFRGVINNSSKTCQHTIHADHCFTTTTSFGFIEVHCVIKLDNILAIIFLY